MNLYAASPESLWSSPAFVRFMACSAAAHVAAIFFVVYGPIFRFRSELPPIANVTLMDMPAEAVAEMTTPEPPAPAPEPPKPPPEPEVKPPEPKPAEPEPPKQVVEEALVVPDVPPEKPRPPKKKAPPAPKPVDVAELMKSVRAEADKNRPPAPASGARGINDPELAAYQLRVRACLNANWAGAALYQRRRDLRVQFLMTVNPTGRVEDVEVTQGSGEGALDDSAERAILKCSPSLPPPPSGVTEIPITFSPGESQ